LATAQATAVDIGELLDKQKLSLFHLGTFLLCALIIIVDAADTGSANMIVHAFAPARITRSTAPSPCSTRRASAATALAGRRRWDGSAARPGRWAIGYVFSAKVPLDTVLYAVAGPYLIVIVLNFMLGRIYRRQFRKPVVATAGE